MASSTCTLVVNHDLLLVTILSNNLVNFSDSNLEIFEWSLLCQVGEWKVLNCTLILLTWFYPSEGSAKESGKVSARIIDSDMNDVGRFLNRLLGLPPEIQNRSWLHPKDCSE